MFKLADTNNIVAGRQVTAKLDHETKQQKRDDEGVPLWTVSGLHEPENSRPETMQVTIAAHQAPEYTPFYAVFTDLEIGMYSMGGKSGLFFRASGIADLVEED